MIILTTYNIFIEIRDLEALFTTSIVSFKPNKKADTTKTGVVCGAHCGAKL